MPFLIMRYFPRKPLERTSLKNPSLALSGYASTEFLVLAASRAAQQYIMPTLVK
jgi:hypothetical protein